MAFISQPKKGTIIDFDTDEFQAGLMAALRTRQKSYALGLSMVAAKVVRGAKSYAPVDTGRLKSAIFQSEVKHEGKLTFIEVGVTLESLQQASANAQGEIYDKIKKGGYAPKSGKGYQTVRRMAVPTVNYGVFMEFGTSKIHARPFMRPALADVADYFGPTVNEAVRE